MKASTKRVASTVALVGGVAVFSTGCTVDEVLTIAKIISFFL